MPDRDSLDKIVGSYFAAVTSRPFTWRGETVEPLPLVFGQSLLRGFTCPSDCGGCCMKFTLDYIPSEQRPQRIYDPQRKSMTGPSERIVMFDGHPVQVFSDMQGDNRGMRCRHLDPVHGRCGVHGKHPFSCDFELIRFKLASGKWRVTEQLFGRGWNMKRVDGGVGAQCTITDADRDTALDVARRLRRLGEWCDHFGLQDHRVPALVAYCELWANDVRNAPRMELA